jgi:hypothetical protein
MKSRELLFECFYMGYKFIFWTFSMQVIAQKHL